MNATAILLNVTFCFAFLAHFIYLLHDDLTKTELYTEMTIVPLADQPFPLRISTCVSPGYNKTEEENAGYNNSAWYQFGWSAFNRSLFGWSGHTVDGKKLYEDPSILQRRLTLWKNLSEFISSFNINGEYKRFDSINAMVEVCRPFHDKWCFSLLPNIFSFSCSPFYLGFHQNIKFPEISIRFDIYSIHIPKYITLQ